MMQGMQRKACSDFFLVQKPKKINDSLLEYGHKPGVLPQKTL
jgi:hypothetical protein